MISLDKVRQGPFTLDLCSRQNGHEELQMQLLPGVAALPLFTTLLQLIHIS